MYTRDFDLNKGCRQVSDLSKGRAASIFVSYRIADTLQTADRLAAELKRTFGPDEVFFDRRTIEPGETWDSRIEAAVKGAKVVLVLIGKRWLKEQDDYGVRRLDVPGDWVRREVEEALNVPGRVVPVLVDDASPSPAAADQKRLDLSRLVITTDAGVGKTTTMQWLEAELNRPGAATVAFNLTFSHVPAHADEFPGELARRTLQTQRHDDGTGNSLSQDDAVRLIESLRAERRMVYMRSHDSEQQNSVSAVAYLKPWDLRFTHILMTSPPSSSRWNAAHNQARAKKAVGRGGCVASPRSLPRPKWCAR